MPALVLGDPSTLGAVHLAARYTIAHIFLGEDDAAVPADQLFIAVAEDAGRPRVDAGDLTFDIHGQDGVPPDAVEG